jgi:hypothetical protein
MRRGKESEREERVKESCKSSAQARGLKSLKLAFGNYYKSPNGQNQNDSQKDFIETQLSASTLAQELSLQVSLLL